MRLGVLGGTFNPIHIAHLRAAEEVRQALGLDRVVFIPAKLPPHKTTGELADAALRLKLVKLAIADNPVFAVSDVELNREGPSFSIDTLEKLIAEEKPDELWFAMGADQYAELHTWKRFGDIIRLVDIAVMTRPPELGEIAPPKTAEGEYEKVGEGYRHRSGRMIRRIEVTPLAISSSAIRLLAARGESVRYLVPETIRELVQMNYAREGR